LDLKTISLPIREELGIFHQIFKSSMHSQVGLVNSIAGYIVKQKGKKVRPILVLLSAKVCGQINDSTYRAATLVELLHTATLIHDDVVDHADTRRGLASINAIWKNKVAVLMGDYLLARGLLLSVEKDDYEFLRITSNAVRRMSEGELLQIQKTRHLDIDERTYFKIISDKTASLISTCCELGAASATQDPEQKQLLREFGENLGIAFQIRDDLFDYLSRKSDIGKPIGLDMKEKKLTLPLIYSFAHSPKSEARRVMKIIRNGAKKKDITAVVEYVQEYGGIDYAIQKAEYYSNLARENLKPFHDSPSRESLLSLVDFVMERNR